MKEEIEEEFYAGQHERIQKGRCRLFRKTALFISEEKEREIERDWENSLFYSFPSSDSLYTSTKKRRERDKLGKIIVSSLFCSSYTSKKIRRDSVCVKYSSVKLES